ncbi:hypothetical protein E2C01_025167 [Portunus trituberculatus]|uniref:Uncharacterized protein n=1 Tax=Portunus trituberculatus TaxID=210409 RepID=A0A5B7EEH8_PORTR|nr:hypothetical protein [Portunus trituberculatus]
MESSWYLYQVDIDVRRYTMDNDGVSAFLTRALHNKAQEALTHQGGIEGGVSTDRDVRLVPPLLVEWLQVWVLFQQGCKPAEKLTGRLPMASREGQALSFLFTIRGRGR